jgi:hemolysin III
MSAQPKLGDILANAVTHGVGAVLSLAGAAVLVGTAVKRGTAWHIASCAVFGAALVLVYVCSTLYHSLVRTRVRRVFRILDHSAIYLLIAGTYTPFTLVSLQGRWGWTLFGVIWALAVAGVVFKSLALGRFAAASAVVYVMMGWVAVVAIRPLVLALGWQGVLWLLAGGVAYTAGVLFFAFDRVRYFHALWHIFVLLGSTLHYFAVLFYVIPSRA